MTAALAPHTKRRGSSAVLGYALLAPSLFGVVVFLLVPIVVVVWLSFQQWDLIGPARFAGLKNWAAVFTDPSFAQSLLVTVVFSVLVVVLQLVLGILVAVLLTQRLPGSGVFRVIFVIPWVCAPLALGVVWNAIFQPTGGALNTILGTHTSWLTSPVLALLCVVTVSVWSQVGYVSLFFMAGLAVIPDAVVEAARVDGAGAARIFFTIKLPLLRPTMFFVLVTSIIGAMQAFDTIYSLTQGGPMNATNVLAYRIYQKAFTAFDLGQAAVTALVLFVILVVVTLAQQLYFRRRITYDLS
ncbi:carbohydrate ABC transporter permease [Humibacter ginsenosidimutans]|uniref:Sugar ABC transporter permease n=1 Tax=Humibacter ginsenosidimutans TaxID=2599293 RepID=A0A5B8M7U8_9MICO|nr:sugar ABC transporter permease [Humibacter ginsenosidimutans]QDZ15672.1 sugar ABC transporter permease [Humibacter ginsenosidimutans]